MSENRLLKKLERLYRLAVTSPEDEADDARMNEARNAAWLLLKLAREGGVAVKFIVRRAPDPSPPAARPAPVNPWPGEGFSPDDLMSAFLRGVAATGPRSPTPGWTVKNKPSNRYNPPTCDVYVNGAKVHTGTIDDEMFPRPPTPRASDKIADAGVITAGFGGTCRGCGKRYDPGERVYWEPGFGCYHNACTPRASAGGR